MSWLFGEWISRKAIDWCRMWTSNRITPVITRHELQDGKTERKLQSGFDVSLLSSTWIVCIASLLSRTRKQDPLRERNSLLSNIKAISYIIACISIQCPTVRQILIKLHHSGEKEWSSLSSSGWNDFIFCLVVWWMMKCWPKNQKWTNKTKQQTRLEYPKDSHWRRKKEIDILSAVFVCLAVNLLRICPHILIEGKLYMSYFSWRHLSAVLLPRNLLCVLLMWRSNICTYFVRPLVYVILLSVH